ncbi:MAG: DHH family phosphoesterase [Clostridia bacterium]|nr:DHH family phosphoesterase [Clostridia bacterium]
MKRYQGLLIFLGAFVLVAAAAFLPLRMYWFALTALVAGILLFAVTFLWLMQISNKEQRLMDRVFRENDSAVALLVNEVTVPALLFDPVTGRIGWRNPAFAEIYDGKYITDLLETYNPARPANSLQEVVRGNTYQIMNLVVPRRHAKQMILQYWLDRTEAAHYQRLYTEQRPYTALIYVDNYEELTRDAEIRSTAVLAEVEGLVSELCKRLDGVYRRYENGRFLLILEAKQAELLEQEKFPLIEAAHRIDTGTGTVVSLSLALGAAPRLAQSEQDARQAMELALGRGGDQAVVKDGGDYRFYGGRRQQDARQSRVKARLFSKALAQLFENSGDVFIMGHKNSDMDCFGSALGIMTCANHVGRHAYIVLDGSNSMIEDALHRMEQDGSAEGLIITPEEAAQMMQPNSVLVIVDTQRASNTVAPELLQRGERIVVIDHHRRSADYIDNSTLHYLESRSSSASEMVTEVLQYFADNVKPASFTCSALLAGITTDTKQFAFNVGSRTFEAAGYLRRNGADLGSVKSMYQNDFDSFVHCAEVVAHATIRRSGIAVSYCEKTIPDSRLICAQAADDLLGIRGIKAAFVLAETDDLVAISGRSFGDINVQMILEKLGGGGHLTMAGAQINGVTWQEAMKKLLPLIEEYEKENSDL